MNREAFSEAALAALGRSHSCSIRYYFTRSSHVGFSTVSHSVSEREDDNNSRYLLRVCGAPHIYKSSLCVVLTATL